MGRSAKVLRVGVACGEGDSLAGIDLKDVAEVIDETPPLPEELWRTIGWFGRNWFLGCGMSLKTLTPAKFLGGEPLEPLPQLERRAAGECLVKYIFEPVDSKRFSTYTQMLDESRTGDLILFPEVAAAKAFWKRLPYGLKDRGVLWPERGQEKQWKLWQSVRQGQFSFVVGSAAAAYLPMPSIRRIIIDDEASAAWRTQKHPEFHRRSLLAERARNAGAELVIGGRIPSAKVALQNEKDHYAEEGIGERAIFVNAYDMRGYEAADIKDKLPISFPLVRETRKALEAGKFALWILDRKGYAGEIYCDDCGSAVFCPACGKIMRWEEKRARLYCAACKKESGVPESCPSCGSGFLAGQRPGIEAVAARAEILFRSGGAVVLFDDKTSSAELRGKYPRGALLIGTRKIIAFADELDVALAGWIDADGEARSAEYDSRARAFGLIWESAWRGNDPRKRTVVIQSRTPGKDWQGDLKRGWGSFWRRELRERKLLGLPPFTPMLKIEVPRGKRAELAGKLEDARLDFWESEDKKNELWVRTRRFEQLRTILTPYFEIANTRVGMPSVTLFLD